MQPYFIPYAGYFRLFAASDLFVIYDCVQFPRRGWLHRNRLYNHQGQLEWLTLPLEKSARETLIRDLRFRSSASDELQAQFRRFPALVGGAASPLLSLLRDMSGTPVDYIERILHYLVNEIDIHWNVIRSSHLSIDPALHGQARIIAIARCVGAQLYINAAGGQSLYDAESFDSSGIALKFLAPYNGLYNSLAERLLSEEKYSIRSELLSQISF